MRASFLKAVRFLLILAYCGVASHVLAASATTDLLNAKKEAETRGYIFVTSRDELVAKAKKEGKMRGLASLEPAANKAMTQGFKKKYPFIDIHLEEIEGTEAFRRFILELKAGRATGWDLNHIAQDFYSEYLPYQKKFDILGMAEQGIVSVPPQIVDPAQRNIVIASCNVAVVAYNKKMISAEKIPDTWEGFLRAEFKGRKFVTDIRPLGIASLVPAWGLEKTLDFARKLASQEPVWARGATRALTSVIAGEHAIFVGLNISAVKRAQEKDPTGVIGYKLVEPVPTRLAEPQGVLAIADHPHAALLWLEFHASPEGQKVMDEFGPYKGSVFVSGSTLERETRGKKLSLVHWEHFSKMEEYTGKVVEAFGFPKEETKR